MSLPSFQQLMLPALQCAGRRTEAMPVSWLEEELTRSLKLSDEEVSRALPSGRESVFANRLNWACSFLARAELLETPRRGHWRATPRARELLAEGVAEIDITILSRYPEFQAWREQQTTRQRELVLESRENPEERIANSVEALNGELSRELIERVHSFSPAFFERLIIDLLTRMGYGGGRSEMGRTLGRSGDGGVDGVIKEDELGLDVVYVQAKRFARDNSVPVREVRDFVGSLEGHRANKGVFMTTSYFPSTAHAFINRVSKRVVLIDGPELANLMIRHRVGVRVKETFEVKRIDEDYFVE
jgi:restriction system protein